MLLHIREILEEKILRFFYIFLIINFTRELFLILMKRIEYFQNIEL